MSRYLGLFDAAGKLSTLRDAEFIAMLQFLGRTGLVRRMPSVMPSLRPRRPGCAQQERLTEDACCQHLTASPRPSPACRSSPRCKRRGWPPSAAHTSPTLSRWPACWQRGARPRRERLRCQTPRGAALQPEMTRVQPEQVLLN